jgi:hypothetical protein
VSVSVLDDLLRDRDVFFKAAARTVDHDRAESAVDAGFAGLKIRAVVKMEHYGQIGILKRRLDKLDEINMLRVLAGARGNLKYNRSVKLARGLGYALNYLHIVDIERAYGVSAGVSFFEHFGTCYQWHFNDHPFVVYVPRRMAGSSPRRRPDIPS